MSNFLQAGILMGFLSVVWVLVALAMILIILLQKGKGGGLSGAFGGAGGGAGLLGTKTGDFLTWVTITLVTIFLVLGIVLGKFLGDEEGTFDDEITTISNTVNGAPDQEAGLETDVPTEPAVDAPEATDTAEAAEKVVTEVTDAAKDVEAEAEKVTE